MSENGNAHELLPHSREIEQAILGAILVEPPIIEKLGMITAQDFYFHKHSVIFQAMRSLWDNSQPIDFVLLMDELERMGEIETAGGPVYVTDLISNTATALYAPQFAEKLKRYATLRKYILMAGDLTRQAYEQENPDMLYGWLQDQLRAIGGAGVSADHVLEWLDSFEAYRQILAQREELSRRPADQRRAWIWPWPSWNRLIDEMDPGMLFTLAGGDGVGKCLGKGTHVVMYDGTLKKVEELQIGDRLMGPDSKPRTVLQLGHGHEQMYWIRQRSGIDYRCNASHLLALYVRDKKNHKDFAIVSAGHIASLPDWYVQRHLQGYKVSIDWPEQELPIDPYFLGVWLGDGSSRSSRIYTPDEEIVKYLQEFAANHDMQCKIQQVDKVFNCCISNGRGGSGPIRERTPGRILTHLNVIQNKHIPQIYLANSKRNRLELLAGLLDTDGYYNNSGHCFEITTKHKRLGRQIKFLADSLGFQTRLRTKQARIKAIGYEITVWRLSISGNVEIIPTKIQRKQARTRQINKDWRVSGFTIKPDGIDEYFGFTIDGDGLFLLEDMTVTHNTTYGEEIAEHWAKEGHSGVYVHFELSKILMLDRRACRNYGLPRRRLREALFTKEEWSDIERVDAEMINWAGNIRYLHSPGFTMEQVIAECRRLHAAGLCDFVIVDYLEKAEMSDSQRRRFREDGVRRQANDVEQLKSFAESHDVRCVMLSQLNKAGKQSSFKALDRTSIRDAGDKTEKANVVALLHRERVENGEYDEAGKLIVEPGGYSREVQVKIDKQTMGATGTLTQYIVGEFFKVIDW